MANLRDALYLEIQAKRLAEPFNVSDVKRLLKAGGGQLAGKPYGKHIGTYLANHSVGPGRRRGASVKEDTQGLFEKHGTALYSLRFPEVNADNFDVEEEKSAAGGVTRSAPRARALRRLPNATRKAAALRTAAERFVAYVREAPYRCLRKSGSGTLWVPTKGPALGWLQRRDEYEWMGSNWARTSGTLARYMARLGALRKSLAASGHTAANQNEAKQIYDLIKKWGNPRGTARNGKTLLIYLDQLWNTGRISRVDSTLTKLYALAAPCQYVIFDSRVATAIVSIAEYMYPRRMVGKKRVDTVDTEFRSLFPHLGTVKSDGGTRQRPARAGWRIAYGSIDAQYEANELCLAILDVLNSNEGEDRNKKWTLRDVEAVLFMEGY